jgi:hypothetical protein
MHRNYIVKHRLNFLGFGALLLKKFSELIQFWFGVGILCSNWQSRFGLRIISREIAVELDIVDQLFEQL